MEAGGAFEALKLAALASAFTTIAVGLIIMCIDTIFDGELKNFITGRCVVSFAKKIWNDDFAPKFFVLIYIVGTLVFWFPAQDFLSNCQKEKEGLCTCNCKACQEIVMKAKAEKVAKPEVN